MDKGKAVFAWMANQPEITPPPPLEACQEEKWISVDVLNRLFDALEERPKTSAELSNELGYSVSYLGLVLRWFVKEGDIEVLRVKPPKVYGMKNGR